MGYILLQLYIEDINYKYIGNIKILYYCIPLKDISAVHKEDRW